MATIGKIKNLERLVAKLRSRAAQAKKDGDVSVAVGYTAKYAIYVHENIGMKLKGQPRPSGKGNYWGPNGQAKFLETPARQLTNGGVLKGIIRTAAQQGKTLAQALVLAGLRLLRESQKVVPVEFGILRASGFVRLTGKK